MKFITFQQIKNIVNPIVKRIVGLETQLSQTNTTLNDLENEVADITNSNNKVLLVETEITQDAHYFRKCKKTFREIKTAFDAGITVIIHNVFEDTNEEEWSCVFAIRTELKEGNIIYCVSIDGLTYRCENPDEKPGADG